MSWDDENFDPPKMGNVNRRNVGGFCKFVVLLNKLKKCVKKTRKSVSYATKTVRTADFGLCSWLLYVNAQFY